MIVKRTHAVRELSSAVLIIICCGAKLYGLMPFGSPMFCALSCKRNRQMPPAVSATLTALIAALYVACEYLFTFELTRVYISGAVAIVMLLRWFIALKAPKLNKPYVQIIFSLLSLVIEAAILGAFVKVTLALINLAVAAVFYYFAARAAELTHMLFAYKLSPVDGAAVCAVLVVFGLAFGRASVDGINIGLAAAVFCATALCVVGRQALVLGGTSIGLGLAVSTDISLGLAFVAGVLVMSAFVSLPRVVYSLAGVAAIAAFSVLFYTDAVSVGWNALICFAGALPVCVLPRRAVKRLRDYFDFDGGAKLAVRHYVNRIKADAGDRMLRLAAVFDETARLMNAFPTAAPDYNALGAALADKVCPYCPKNAVCNRAEADKAFSELAERAYSGERIIAELPEFFSKSCRSVTDVTGSAAFLTDKRRETEKNIECDEKVRKVLTERLTAVREVLTELGVNQAQPVGFDSASEKKIADELLLCGVECADAFVTRDGVTAIVRDGGMDREKIRKAVSACLKARFDVVDVEKSSAAGWSVATLKKRPTYDAVYARAGVSKSGGVSGDSYTFKRIGDMGGGEKFLAALCDGMGSGENAEVSSNAAVELIECFYKAGFDSKSVLTGVNRFLKTDGERYSAADIAVCDLTNATVDIIKIGAPACYIKTRDTVLKIEGSSLPIGVLDEMRPFVTSKKLYPGQMYIAVSDGVSDCFDGDGLPAFINGLEPFNPEKAANAVLTRAIELVGAPRDDMTVIAFRLFTPTRKKLEIKN